MAEQAKRCTQCQRDLPLDQFYHEKKRGQPYIRAECKDCKNLKLTAWRSKKRKHYNTYMRRYSKNYRQQYGDPTHPERVKRWALNKVLSRTNGGK